MPRLFVSLLALATAGGCVLAVTEDGDSCGEHATYFDGACRCISGYAGDPDERCDPIMGFIVNDRCDDDTDVEWKLFAPERDWSWPEGDEVYVTPGAGFDQLRSIACVQDEDVCYGAQTTDGSTTYGVGIDGSDECNDCCFRCGNYDVDLFSVFVCDDE